ncbi:MAG TPA: D-2-hydroxyacid dehydrogenase [Thermomicrobiales bacterium]|nr:D-2-hydroxyacid dehydrogenase [Thermomicrobiales bacterium]
MNRPTLRKIVFAKGPREHRIDALRAEFPDLTLTVAAEDALAADIADAQAMVGGKLEDGVLDAARELAWLHVPFAGVERVLTPELVARGITITNSRGVSAPNMAEHAVAMMLAFGRGLPTFIRWQDQRIWRDDDHRPAFFELTGQTVVLLGVGAIGQAIAARLRPFGVRIIGARRQVQGPEIAGFDRVVPFSALEEVLPEADHVVSSLPMTPATKGIVSADLIARMKPGARFYNVGRGGTVDQQALIGALRDGRLAGAGLDVTDPEPLPDDSPLWAMSNVILTGHTSGTSPMAEARVYEVLAENIRRYRDGRDLLNVVDVEWGY